MPKIEIKRDGTLISGSFTDEEKNTLVKLGRKILFITAIYFIINAFIGLKKEKNKSQYKQVIAAIFALIASFIRLTIKDDDITFR